MRLCGIFEGRPGASLVPGLALWLWIGVAGAAEGQVPQSSSEPEPVEEIEIIGRGSLISLRLEIDNAETRMFDLFNQLNDVRQFNMSCREIIVTGRRISPGRECVPLYMKWDQMNSTQNALLFDISPPSPNDRSPVPANGGAVSVNTRTTQQTDGELSLRNQHKHQEFNAKFRELAAQHPELASATLDLQAKRQRLQELEERRRKGGVLGRFFSRSGGKDKE